MLVIEIQNYDGHDESTGTGQPVTVKLNNVMSKLFRARDVLSFN